MFDAAKAADSWGFINNLPERWEAPVVRRGYNFSGGQRQRVTIARALVNQPAIVWADEPTGDLDRENSVEIMKLMQQLTKEKGQTFVIVTHDSKNAEMTHRIIKMESGVIVKDWKNPQFSESEGEI